MSQQTNYNVQADVARAGHLSDVGPRDIISGAASAVIPFGRAVSFNSSRDSFKLPAVAADVNTGLFAGFAVLDTGREASDGYPVNESVSALRVGRIWVETIDAATLGGAVYVVVTAGANQGKVSNSSGSGTILAKAKFLGTLGAAGLVEIQLDGV